MSTLLTTRWLHKAPFELDGMSLEMPELTNEHPNRVPWRGILTQVDEASTRPPNGSSGHRVLIPRGVAEQALPSLMGMPVDCSLGLKDHDKKKVVGVITDAEIQGNDLVVAGHLLSKNFPEEVEEIQSKKSQLGMSYEISDVQVEDVDAPVWTLTGLQFTGAAILYKNAAAYQHTAIAARAEEDEMPGAETLLKKLEAIDTRLRGMEAARMDEDDEAAAKDEAAANEHEATAARLDAAAQQAREDSDDEDAQKQEADAAKARVEASRLRLAAAKRHEDAAMKLRAAEHQEEAAKQEAETDAARHEAEAKRLRDMDDKCHAEAEAARADLVAARKQGAAADDDASTARMMAAMVRAMAEARGTQQAAKSTKKDEDPDPMERMFGMFLRAMTYMPGMMDSSKEHPDEEQDKELIRNLLRKGTEKGSVAASAPVVNIEERRRLRRIEAAMELLTDQVSKLAGLLTDTVHSRRDLATDAHHGANGGAVRRTMQATTEQWVGKYDSVETGTTTTRRTDGKMTMQEIEAALDKEGITEPTDRIAKIVNLQLAGKVAN